MCCFLCVCVCVCRVGCIYNERSSALDQPNAREIILECITWPSCDHIVYMIFFHGDATIHNVIRWSGVIAEVISPAHNRNWNAVTLNAIYRSFDGRFALAYARPATVIDHNHRHKRSNDIRSEIETIDSIRLNAFRVVRGRLVRPTQTLTHAHTSPIEMCTKAVTYLPPRSYRSHVMHAQFDVAFVHFGII